MPVGALADRFSISRPAVSRAAHAVIHLSGFGHLMARTVVFTVAWIAFVVLSVEVLLSAIR